MSVVAVIELGADDRLILRSRYEPTLVDALKQAIPYAFRSWDAAAKVWRIDADWADVLVQALEDCGVTVSDRRPVTSQPVAVASPLQQACQCLFITPDAPMEVVEAAFKALAKRHHPDVGGDTATMQSLNEAIHTFKAFNEGAC